MVIPIGRDFRFSLEGDDGAMHPLNLRDEATHLAMQRLDEETERWCWRAIRQGVGNRVWRSDPLAEPWPSTVTRYQFAILGPGQPAPGKGMIFGPFSQR